MINGGSYLLKAHRSCVQTRNSFEAWVKPSASTVRCFFARGLTHFMLAMKSGGVYTESTCPFSKVRDFLTRKCLVLSVFTGRSISLLWAAMAAFMQYSLLTRRARGKLHYWDTITSTQAARSIATKIIPGHWVMQGAF